MEHANEGSTPGTGELETSELRDGRRDVELIDLRNSEAATHAPAVEDEARSQRGTGLEIAAS
jgi:hypothetical protein